MKVQRERVAQASLRSSNIQLSSRCIPIATRAHGQDEIVIATRHDLTYPIGAKHSDFPLVYPRQAASTQAGQALAKRIPTPVRFLSSMASGADKEDGALFYPKLAGLLRGVQVSGSNRLAGLQIVPVL